MCHYLKRSIAYTLVVFQLFLYTYIQAQVVHNLNIDNGLAHADAECVVQDKQGYIWIGTGAGLQRYDGYELKTYQVEPDMHFIPSTRIISMILVGDYLWLLTRSGVKVFYTLEERYIPFVGEQWEHMNTSAIILREKTKQQLWAIIQGELYLLNYQILNDVVKIETQRVQLPGYQSTKKLNAMESNAHTLLWIANDSIIYQYQQTKEGLKLDWKYALPQTGKLLWETDKQQLWAMSNAALRCIKLTTKQRTYAIENVNRRYLMDDFHLEGTFLIDFTIIEGDVFLAVNREGLYQIRNIFNDNIQIQHYQVGDGTGLLSSNSVQSIYYSREKCIFVCQNDGGVNIIDNLKKRFNTLTYIHRADNALENLNSVSAIAEDSKGNLWIGTRNDGLILYSFATGRGVKFEDYIGYSETYFYNIKELVLQDDTLFIAGNEGVGVLSLSDKKYQHISRTKLGSKNAAKNILSIARGETGSLWVGYSQGGFDKIRYGNPTNIIEQSIRGVKTGSGWHNYNKITHLFYDTILNVLLVSDQHSVSRYQLNTKFQAEKPLIYFPYSNDHPNRGNTYLWDFIQTSANELWVGNIGFGLCQMELTDSIHDDGSGVCRIKCFGTSSGAPSNSVESLLLDNNGNIWMGSRGLSCFNTTKSEFWNFDIGDGISSNGFLVRSACQGQKGTMYFGGVKGITYFNPDSIQRNNILPNVTISNIFINQRAVRRGESILGQVILTNNTLKVGHAQNNIAIEFTALHYANPGKHKYRYRLVGYDDHWIAANSSNRRAIYSNLNYGDYTFLVDGTNNDGLWSNSPYTLHISVIAPWWQTTVAYMVYFLIILAVLASFYFYRIRLLKLRHNLKIAELQTQNQEELLKTKLQFFTNISHEFKVHLSLIYAPLERLLSSSVADGATRINLYRAIKRNVNRLLQLVNELMEFRKVETGNLQLSISKVNLNNFLVDIAEIFIGPMEQKQIRYNYSISNKLAQGYVDTETVTKIAVNLIANALKYTSSKGHVDVDFLLDWSSDQLKYNSAYHIANYHKSEKNLFIRVVDSGIGISPESIGQIFDRFFQIEESEEEQHLGSGIGLAYTKSLVMLHKGELWVSSERNKGAEFVVALPMSKEFFEKFNDIEWRDESREPVLPLQVKLTPEVTTLPKEIQIHKADPEFDNRILIVDDNSEMRMYLVEWLSKFYWVDEASNGQEALQKLGESAFDLLITDVMMPFMDGYELTQIVKNDLRYSHIPIIMLTAKSSLDDQVTGAQSGADVFIPKPFSLKFIERTIANLFRLQKTQKNRYKTDPNAGSDIITHNAHDKQFIENVVKLIEDNIQDSDFKLDQLYKGIGMSKTPFYNKLKAITDLSPQEFVRNIRLKHAARLLVSGQTDISQIAFDVGFKNHSHFSKVFKSEFGCSPKDFQLAGKPCNE